MPFLKHEYCIHGHRLAGDNVRLVVRKDRADYRQCRTCISNQSKSPQSRLTRKLRSESKQVWILNYLKEHPCVDCGETDPVVLVFDHCRGKKLRDVTGLISMSTKTILREIKKCDVVCANDHARRTAKRANTIRWKLRK
jgi:hypothetical protein